VPLLRVPFGDAVFVAGLEIPGLHPAAPPRPVFHIGVPTETSVADRVVKPPPYSQFTGKVDVRMDLQADKKVALSVGYTDEVGNPAPAPEGAVATYTVDDPTIINLTDNGDGTASAAAVGPLGTANVHLSVEFDDEDGVAHEVTGDLQLVVVAGDAERVEIVPGAVEEVTPDA
jgi:hypothetical protein